MRGLGHDAHVFDTASSPADLGVDYMTRLSLLGQCIISDIKNLLKISLRRSCPSSKRGQRYSYP